VGRHPNWDGHWPLLPDGLPQRSRLVTPLHPCAYPELPVQRPVRSGAMAPRNAMRPSPVIPADRHQNVALAPCTTVIPLRHEEPRPKSPGRTQPYTPWSRGVGWIHLYQLADEEDLLGHALAVACDPKDSRWVSRQAFFASPVGRVARSVHPA
jgi:hypothetical protein